MLPSVARSKPVHLTLYGKPSAATLSSGQTRPPVVASVRKLAATLLEGSATPPANCRHAQGPLGPPSSPRDD